MSSSWFQDKAYRKQIEILRILSEYSKPVGSSIIRKELAKRGFFLSERAIRYHLKILEERGLVEGHERAGRMITGTGLEELSKALAYERMGSILTEYLALAYETTYAPNEDRGEVVTNVFLMDKKFEETALTIIRDLYDAKLLPSPYVKVLDEEEEYRELAVPHGKMAILTVCNLTVDGVLLKNGIPLILKYGGLVQFLRGKPVRFVDIISYEHVTIHPLEIFVYKQATTVLRILENGSGLIPANMREIPAVAKDRVIEVIGALEERGWGGILAVGMPNEPILGIPVSMDRFGVSMVGGVTPAAAMKEAGIDVEVFAPHCLVDIKDMKKI
ncbi:MAG: NrpR regulatory domain-containing protein [Nitrososphaeria archaeon]|nr:NrpR regulatory domain-containing protein [Nitrososphaeria archaeon]